MKLFDDVMSVIRTEMPFMAERRNPTDNKWYYFVVTQHGDGVTLNFTDISERKRYESRLEHAALHDTLTCLPNRKALEERLEQAIHRRQRVAGYDFAVLFLDFDRFKIINDSLGHEAGDELLIKIADKLLENLRTGDTASRLSGDHLPARLGGDEFVILLDGITDKRDSVIVADRLLQTFLEPHHIAGHNVTSTASIGIVISGDGYENAEDVLRDADTAMYHAKHKGKARYEIFDRNMHVAVVQRMTIEKELRDAVENGTFTLEYEPIVALDTGQVDGFEALIRWPHPTRGIIPPDEFIGIAEELGLITAMGQWVLEKACAQLQEWSKKKSHEKVFVNVNLSKLQLRDPNLVPTVERLIRKTKIRPGSLRLEITETMVMDDLKQISIVLGHLKSLGVQLAMDDFGTGHSSLNSLHRFPIDILKIDRSFIDTKDKGTSAWSAIIPATIALAHRLELVVVAEGVEKVDQLEMLRGLSCDYAQGHLFSKSLSAAEASQYMDQVQGFGDKASAA
jgi:diguanylate cyclase (GGDEF)-like protein